MLIGISKNYHSQCNNKSPAVESLQPWELLIVSSLCSNKITWFIASSIELIFTTWFYFSSYRWAQNCLKFWFMMPPLSPKDLICFIKNTIFMQPFIWNKLYRTRNMFFSEYFSDFHRIVCFRSWTGNKLQICRLCLRTQKRRHLFRCLCAEGVIWVKKSVVT